MVSAVPSPRVSVPELGERMADSAAQHRDLADVDDWLAECASPSRIVAVRSDLEDLEAWRFEPGSGDLVHQTRRFFAVRGVEVSSRQGAVRHWTQPILDQPEQGVLGFLVAERDGVLHFLAQAKNEPGNVNGVQVAPTVQATRSKYLGFIAVGWSPTSTTSLGPSRPTRSSTPCSQSKAHGSFVSGTESWSSSCRKRSITAPNSRG